MTALQILIDAYRRCEDTNAVAARMNMPSCTARTIINKYRKDHDYAGPKKRGGDACSPHTACISSNAGAFRVLYDREAMMRQLIPWLCSSKHVDASIKLMLEFLGSRFSKAPCKSTVGMWLEHELLLVPQPRPASRLCVELGSVMEARRDYAAWRAHPDRSSRSTDIVYIGAHGTSLWTRNGGKEPARAPAAAFSPCMELNCFIAVSAELGPMHCQAGTHSDFAAFLRKTLDLFGERAPGRRPILVSDGLLDAEYLRAAFQTVTQQSSVECWSLASHSAMLSAATAVARLHARHMHDVFMFRRPALAMQLEALRMREDRDPSADAAYFATALRELVEVGWRAVTPDDIVLRCKAVDEMLPKCAAGQLLELYAEDDSPL